MIRHKQLLCIILGVIVFSSSHLLFAASRSLDLKSIGSSVSGIEYSYEGDEWHRVDMDTLHIQVPHSQEEGTLLLNLDLGKAIPAAPLFFDLRALETAASAIEYSWDDNPWRAVDMETLQIPLSYTDEEETLLLVNISRDKALPITSTTAALLDLRALDTEASRIEYSHDDKPWRDVDMEKFQIPLPFSEEEETILLINLHRGSTALSIPPVEEEEPVREGMEVILRPYVTAMITDNVLRHMYTLPFGLGLDASFTFPFCRDLVFKVDAEVKFAISNNIWATSFILFGADVGVGYRFNLPANFSLTPSLSYGLYLHHGFESVLEQPLFLTHHIGADVEVAYRLNPDMHVFVAPHVQMMIDKTRNGFLYGLRAGVGFTL